MQGSAKQRSVNAEGLDTAAFQSLLAFLPNDLREFADTTLTKARELYECDRHYEVVAAVESVLERCKQTLQTASLEDAPMQENIEPVSINSTSSTGTLPTTAVKPLPTALSVAIFHRFVESSLLYTFALNRIALCDSLTREIEDDEGWKLVSDHGNGDGTYYRYDEANDAHFFKVRGTVQVSILYACSVIMELDLFSEWFPSCRKSVSQGEVSRYYRSAYMLIGVPWPFSSREVLLLGAGIDDMEARNRIVIVAHSIPFAGMEPRKFVASDATPGACTLNEPGVVLPGINVPAHNNSNVVCDIIYTGFEVKMRTPTETQLSFILSIDPKVPNIPRGVLNWLSGKVMWGMLGDMEAAAKKAMQRGSKYHKRRCERPDVYDLLRKRYNDVLKSKYTQDDYVKYALKADY
ncbi:hypothetical protein ABL78_1147 [Leptomonas seymouri]|uniref:START domain-containing protein n=1 Tax=Leptomonas seymouri TaxID=5684 RepID=A0A0N0P8P5_LEPSE|nr:hypothetical protein ABL78_1147 [Leptomonas seymouri]|eukprot:KPI89767.1 hypothetical protein ABL78_1147 [Leptomonas seymouri]